jgi:peptidoglycan/xylan/chitin deacetylase (PgdA/CDA1 family)
MTLAGGIKKVILRGAGRFYGPHPAREPEFVIVIYHRVGSRTDSPIDVPLSTFEAQLDFLRDHYEVVSMDRALDLCRRRTLRHSIAVLSFDDGYWDFYARALPAMVRRGLPGILYVSTQCVETQERFPWDTRWSGPGWDAVRPISWAQLAEAAATGLVTVASHGHSHARFDRLTPAALHRDLAAARAGLLSNLSIDPTHLACPKGIYSNNLSRVTPQPKTIAVGGWRPNRVRSFDPKRLHRVPATVSPDLVTFGQTLRGAGWPIGVLAGVRDRWAA